MPSLNSINNQHIDISLFFNILNNNIYKDNRFIQLLSLVNEDPRKYTYACYTESSYLKENIYIPVFHTLYLASKFHNVIIENINDSWLVETFPNNNYYILSNNESELLESHKIKIINNLREIGEI